MMVAREGRGKGESTVPIDWRPPVLIIDDDSKLPEVEL
jgi:hypothetical protein